MFGAREPISVIGFLYAFKLARATNKIHESAVMWLFHFFTKGSSATALNARLVLKPTLSLNTPWAKERMLRTYLEVVNVLLQNYVTDDVIAESDSALTRYIQPSTMSPTQYVNAPVAKSHRCGEVYDEYVVK